MPDDVITIVEHEIEALGLNWISTQNSRTLVLTNENLDYMRQLLEYPAVVPQEVRGGTPEGLREDLYGVGLNEKPSLTLFVVVVLAFIAGLIRGCLDCVNKR